VYFKKSVVLSSKPVETPKDDDSDASVKITARVASNMSKRIKTYQKIKSKEPFKARTLANTPERTLMATKRLADDSPEINPFQHFHFGQIPD
jgi:hypothetical protein